ncbi:MAG: hypothetical protein HXY35_16845 [Chloroflexi bacterium]|nr:hypothetical protein [Chloroflexota bacterium]
MKISKKAELYTWRELARRAGLPIVDSEGTGFEHLNLPVHYGSPEDAPKSPALIVCRSREEDWRRLLTLPLQDLRWIPSTETIPPGTRLPFNNPTPVLFWGVNADRSTTPFAEKLPNRSLVFHADILAGSFFMLSRWEETTGQPLDSHFRFPASASVAGRLGFLDIPVVDQYALILREWLRSIFPHWKPQRNIPAINLTHDIDHVYQYSSPLSFVRAVTVSLLSKQPLSGVKREFRSLWTQWFAPSKGEKYRAIYELANLSTRHGFTSRFYFMAAHASLKQQGYDPAMPMLQTVYKFLLEEGHEIGFHPGYTTFLAPSVLESEKKRLEQAFGTQITGGRQHFLRFKVPDTWRDWQQTGMQYDSTLGYADREGFRCGTCHPYRPFDLENDREMQLLEIPLIVMDTTLIEYRKLTLAQSHDRILELARACVEVEGMFTLLWHNVTMVGKHAAWGNMYANILPELKDIISNIR